MATNIINKHMLIKNAPELLTYISEKVKNNHYGDLFVENTGKNVINFQLNDVFFSIRYFKGMALEILCDQKNSKEEKLITSIIRPVMWNSVLDSDSHKPTINIPRYPIIEYDDNMNLHHIYWNVYNPLDMIKYIAFDYHVLDTILKNVKIDYENYDLENSKELIKLGDYPADMSLEKQKELYEINEFELFLLLSSIQEKMKKLESKPKKERSLSDNILCATYLYQTEYIKQVAAKRFNIKVNKPEFKHVEQTPEIIAWEKWWRTGYEKEQKKYFSKLAWQKFPKGYNPNFRPKGSYLDLITQNKEK